MGQNYEVKWPKRCDNTKSDMENPVCELPSGITDRIIILLKVLS